MSHGDSASANPVIVEPVSGKRALGAFIRLPRILYAGMPGFVAPLDLERRGLLDPAKSGFFAHGRAQYFLASRGGQPIGRISAQIDEAGLKTWGEAIGCFGCLDAIDDRSVVAALLHAARGWLLAQGMQRMRGPLALSINGETGLLATGQALGSVIMNPWHPAYLAHHLEALGLPIIKTLVSYTLPKTGAGWQTRQKRGEALRRRLPKLRVRGLDPKRLPEEGRLLRDLFNDAWHDNWSFVPLTQPEVDLMIRELKPVLVHDDFVVIELDGEAVAFALMLPNLYDALEGVGGAPSPAGWAKLAWRMYRRRYRSARVLLLGVRRRFRDSTLGALLAGILMDELLERFGRYPYEAMDLGWVLEDNTRMRRLIESLGVQPSRTFLVYEESLNNVRA